ncbi:MAG TPA: diacylglycerol kinase family protein [Polyangia bacterium]|nr:diacylglycerol kinase family protein [Polyangia bacterium]
MIGIITNPNALGLVRDKTLARRLGEIVGPLGVVFETRTPEELRDAVRELHARQVDIVATCGGDGTNLSTLTEMVRVWQGNPASPAAAAAASASGRPGNGVPPRNPHSASDAWVSPSPASASTPGSASAAGARAASLPQFGILRGGTVNTVANNLAVRGHPEEILERLVARIRSGRQVPSAPLDLLRVGGMYGFLFGAAMPGRFFEAYYGGPTTGMAWAGALAARTLASGIARGPFARWLFDPIEIEITVDGVTLPTRHFTLIVAATVRNVGIGVKVTYRAGQRPGRFHLVASSLPASRMVVQAARVFGGRPLKGQPHTDVLAARARLRFAEPQTYTLDGDLFRASEVELACGPRLDILTP